MSANLTNELLRVDPGNLLPASYVSVTPPGDVSLSTIYGPDSNYRTLMDLKQKCNPQNVFSLAGPRLVEQKAPCWMVATLR
jgi:hypothetical protein